MQKFVKLILLFVSIAALTCVPIQETDEDPSLTYPPREIVAKLTDFNIEKLKKSKMFPWDMRSAMGMEIKKRDENDNEEVFNKLLVAGFIGQMQNLALIRVDNFRKVMKHTERLIEPYDPSNSITKSTIGSKECEWDQAGKGSICPHYFQVRYRENMYPKLSTVAVCSCRGCLSQYSTDGQHEDRYNTYSYCSPVYSYFPALMRTDNTWKFVIEQVPTSCTCKMFLNEEKKKKI